MNRKKNKICLALPVKTSNINQIGEKVSEILEVKPDFIELRFDFIEDVSHITPSFLKKLLEFTDIPFIFTFRSNHEGGHIDIPDHDRIRIIKRLIDAKPQYIDIEIQSPLDLLQNVFGRCNRKKVKIILSYHNFQGINSLNEAEQLIENCKKKINPILRSSQGFHFPLIFKLIFTATKFEDNLIPLKLCKQEYKKDHKIISFCMGELGLFSRIMCVRAGSFLTYAALHEKTAPGQIEIEKMKEIYSIL
jgi:3-dehydroquinate dehydratase type I